MDARRAARLDTELWELLRTVGLRATRPRLEVLRFLRDAGGHHSADEIVGLLRQRAVSLPRASVFGIVDALSNAGLIRVATTGPGRTLYEWAGEAHHHFLCRVCNTVYDVPCRSGATPCLGEQDLPGRLEEAQIVFRGVCKNCL